MVRILAQLRWLLQDWRCVVGGRRRVRTEYEVFELVFWILPVGLEAAFRARKLNKIMTCHFIGIREKNTH